MFKSMTVNEIMQHPYAAKLGNLTTLVIFYDTNTDEIILNSDNKDFDLYSKLVLEYMEAERAERAVINEYAILRNVTRILDKVIEFRKRQIYDAKAKEMLKIIRGQSLSLFYENIDMIDALKRIEEPGYFFNNFNLFMYGYIQGKRAERARRKNSFKYDGNNIQKATLKQILTNRIKSINDLGLLQDILSQLNEKEGVSV